MAGFSSESGLCFNEANESFTTYEEHSPQFIEANGIEEGKQRADIVNNFECTTTSLRTFQQTPPRTDSVSSHEGNARARGTAEKAHDREEILDARETTFNTCPGEGHAAATYKNRNSRCQACNKEGHLEQACRTAPARETANQGGSSGKPRAVRKSATAEQETRYIARETANQGGSSGKPRAVKKSATAEQETRYIAREPASMGPRATGLRHQSAHTNRESATKRRYTSGDFKRPAGSSSQTDLEEPKKDDRIRRANKIKNDQETFIPLSSCNPAIYKLNLRSTGNDQFCIKDFGSPVLGTPNKTIMLLGATGSGKTTLINGMINYILGVEWEDEWRFKLIDEVTSKTQAESQTSEVTAYQIHHNNDFKVPYSLTIIDTPGFGDTRGIEQDKEITEKIRQFFTQQDGIASIDAVCFVVQSALARLTHTQKYIFEAVLSIFGKDIASNIISMITFADGQKPPVLEAIRAADIPCATKEDGSLLHFKFNNSALYASNKQADDEEGSFDQMFWKMGEGSMKRFFNSLNTMETQSLQLTKEVLTERKQLEATVAGVQPLIQIGLAKLNEIQETTAALHQHQSAIDANKDFTYEVEIPVAKKVDLPEKVYVTNCLKCNYTCHPRCAYANDADKIHCSAMKNSYCTVCPSKCIWSVHHNMKYKFVIEMKKETRTYENLKKQYEEAQGEKMTAEQIIVKLELEYEEVQINVFKMTDEMARSLSRLQEIALRPDPLSTPGYIELLIAAEKQECKPGYKKRVAELQNVLKGAVIVNKVAKGEPLTDKENKMNLFSRFTKWLGLQTKK